MAIAGPRRNRDVCAVGNNVVLAYKDVRRHEVISSSHRRVVSLCYNSKTQRWLQVTDMRGNKSVVAIDVGSTDPCAFAWRFLEYMQARTRQAQKNALVMLKYRVVYVQVLKRGQSQMPYIDPTLSSKRRVINWKEYAITTIWIAKASWQHSGGKNRACPRQVPRHYGRCP